MPPPAVGVAAGLLATEEAPAGPAFDVDAALIAVTPAARGATLTAATGATTGRPPTLCACVDAAGAEAGAAAAAVTPGRAAPAVGGPRAEYADDMLPNAAELLAEAPLRCIPATDESACPEARETEERPCCAEATARWTDDDAGAAAAWKAAEPETPTLVELIPTGRAAGRPPAPLPPLPPNIRSKPALYEEERGDLLGRGASRPQGTRHAT